MLHAIRRSILKQNRTYLGISIDHHGIGDSLCEIIDHSNADEDATFLTRILRSARSLKLLRDDSRILERLRCYLTIGGRKMLCTVG